MIYVDTVSGKIIVDTETDRVKETIVITRNASGIHIEHRAKGKEKTDRDLRWFFRTFRDRSFMGIGFQW